MRIKIAALAMLFADIILLFSAGYYLSKAPRKGTPRHDQLTFLLRSYVLVAVLLVCLLATVILVYFWMNHVRNEFREQAKANLESLIEGTLKDHERKKI